MSVLGGRISVNNNASLSNVNGKIVLAAAANMRPQQLGDAKAAEIKQEEKADEVSPRTSPDSSTSAESNNNNISPVVSNNNNNSANGSSNSRSLTRCPICQKYIMDLPQHIALSHSGGASVVTSTEETNSSAINLVKGASAEAATPIPVFLPQHPAAQIIASQQQRKIIQIVQKPVIKTEPSPINLTVKKSSCDAVDDIGSMSPSNNNGNPQNISAAEAGADGTVQIRKRRKQTHVPEHHKDERYWTRRLKNNEAAKRSRDMRIRRERVVFDENRRLEGTIKELREDLDRVATENKELHLKMDIVMEENSRLKALLLAASASAKTTD